MRDEQGLRAVVLDDGELNNLLMAAAPQPVASCTAHDFTVPAEALAFAAAHADEIGVFATEYEMPGMTGAGSFTRCAVVKIWRSDDNDGCFRLELNKSKSVCRRGDAPS